MNSPTILKLVDNQFIYISSWSTKCQMDQMEINLVAASLITCEFRN